MKEKRKVGRPKLASTGLKRQSILLLFSVFLITIIVLVLGATTIISIKLRGSIYNDSSGLVNNFVCKNKKCTITLNKQIKNGSKTVNIKSFVDYSIYSDVNFKKKKKNKKINKKVNNINITLKNDYNFLELKVNTLDNNTIAVRYKISNAKDLYYYDKVINPFKNSYSNAYTKVLLVGNSYTFYNGYGQILCKLALKDKKNLVVVRATKGGATGKEFINNKLQYVAWSTKSNGEKIASGDGYLSSIINTDFGNLKRSGNWDYVFFQNNIGNDKIEESDKAMFNYFYVKKHILDSKKFIIDSTYFNNNTGVNKHLNAARKGNFSLLNSGNIIKKYGLKNGLIIKDSNNHPSPKGAYLHALITYAKIYGTNSYPKIKLYNTKKGSANEFIKDKYCTGTGTFNRAERDNYATCFCGNNTKQGCLELKLNVTKESYSIDSSSAKKLQKFVKKQY